MSVRDEFDFIKKVQPATLHHSGLIGIGDDAAIFSVDARFEQIVCVDTMVEDKHFLPTTMSPFHIGYKSLVANISDIAAMGGIPQYYLVSISIPSNWKESELLEIYDGLKKAGDEHKMDLIGGDTTSTNSKLVISVTAIGKVEAGRRLLRSNAEEGDVIFVSGTLGDAAGGLDVLLEGNKEIQAHNSYLISRHQTPTPRVTLGRILSQFNRVSLNDVSDGLVSELKEISNASNVSMVIDSETIPYSDALLDYNKEKALKWALTGGEDFELVGTISNEHWEQLSSICEKENIPLSKIGYVQGGKGKVYIRSNNGALEEVKNSGYNHFFS